MALNWFLSVIIHENIIGMKDKINTKGLNKCNIWKRNETKPKDHDVVEDPDDFF